MQCCCLDTRGKNWSSLQFVLILVEENVNKIILNESLVVLSTFWRIFLPSSSDDIWKKKVNFAFMFKYQANTMRNFQENCFKYFKHSPLTPTCVTELTSRCVCVCTDGCIWSCILIYAPFRKQCQAVEGQEWDHAMSSSSENDDDIEKTPDSDSLLACFW